MCGGPADCDSKGDGEQSMVCSCPQHLSTSKDLISSPLQELVLLSVQPAGRRSGAHPGESFKESFKEVPDLGADTGVSLRARGGPSDRCQQSTQHLKCPYEVDCISVVQSSILVMCSGGPVNVALLEGCFFRSSSRQLKPVALHVSRLT